MSIVLTDGQQAAYSEIITLLTTDRKELVITGFAGTGKTTLINSFLEEWPQFVTLSGGAFKDIAMYLTATTNKAADALAAATGRETGTIHSLVGLRVVNTGYRTSKLVKSGKEAPSEGLVIIDEASFLDDEMLFNIRTLLPNCKLLFLGDPCQLKPVGSDNTPVFDAGIVTAHLTQIVRQSDDSPIQKLSRDLRDHVAGGPLPQIPIDGYNLVYMDREDFDKAFVADCLAMAGNSVRALSWTNAVAIEYNKTVAQARSGGTDFCVGDVVVVNKQVTLPGRISLATDSTVQVAKLSPWSIDSNGIESRDVVTSYGLTLRQARHQSEAEELIKAKYDENRNDIAYVLQNLYVDLRLMFASTVNKSQGSTYDTVYVDLDDIGKCRDKDQVRRMLYVAVSRARHKVVFTGDI